MGMGKYTDIYFKENIVKLDRQWLRGHGHDFIYDPSKTFIKQLVETQYRTVKRDWGWVKNWYDLELLHNGKWFKVSRTDLKDDVCTGRQWTMEQFIDKALSDNILGVRLYKERDIIAIIDSWSDG